MLPSLSRYFPCFLLPAAGPLAAAVIISAVPAPAQTPVIDGQALMQSAAQLNGLSADGVHPWHLKVSYTLTDDSGKPAGLGTLEELWAAPNHYKTILTGPGYSETAYGSDTGDFRPISPAAIPEPVAELAADLTDPLPSADAIRYEDYLVEQKSLGAAKLACIAARVDSGPHTVVNTGQVYCLDAEKPILRIRDNAALKTRALYNVLVIYQGRYVARDLRIIRDGKPALTAHLDALEPLASFNPADLDPPKGGMFVTRSINLAPDIAETLLLRKITPRYPASTAGESGTVGTVAVEAHIDANGHVRDARAMNGPVILQQPAVEAVKQWLYRPYLKDGEAVGVITTIHVAFDPFQ